MIKNIFITFFALFFAFSNSTIVLAQEIAKENTEITIVSEEKKETESSSREEVLGDFDTEETTSNISGLVQGQEEEVTICHANNGVNGFVVMTVPISATDGDGANDHGAHEGDIIPILDQNEDGEITVEDCQIVAGQDGGDDEGNDNEGEGEGNDEENNDEDTENPTILSCEDVTNTQELLVYLAEFDGEPNCTFHPVVEHLDHYNVFPGEDVVDLVEVSLDGVMYDLTTLPYFKLDTIDTIDGFVYGDFTFPQNFPNWAGEDAPVIEESLFIDLTFHTCETILGSAEVLLEYLARFNPNSVQCEIPNESSVLSIQDEITIFQGTDLLSQLEVLLDGEIAVDLETYMIVGDFSSDVLGVFVVEVVAQKGDTATIEEVVVTVIAEETNNEDSNNDSENSGGGGGSSSSSGSGIFNPTSTGQVLGAFDEVGGEVLGDFASSCPAFSQFHRRGDRNGEVPLIQDFLNTHMQAGLVVDGIFGPLTEKAVHNFQQKYWEQTIKPWTPVLSPKTTGRWYKTTKAWANELSNCREEAVILEDTGMVYSTATFISQ